MAHSIPSQPAPSATSGLDPALSTTLDSEGALGDLLSPELSGPIKPKLPSGMILLSEWLKDVPSNELILVLDDYEEGVRTTLESLPVDDETFTLQVVDPVKSPKAQARVVAEEVLRDTEEARAWLQVKRGESRYHVMRKSGKVNLSIDEVVKGVSDFDRLMQERRAFLDSQKKTAQPEKATPTRPKRDRSRERSRAAEKRNTAPTSKPEANAE